MTQTFTLGLLFRMNFLIAYRWARQGDDQGSSQNFDHSFLISKK